MITLLIIEITPLLIMALSFLAPALILPIAVLVVACRADDPTKVLSPVSRVLIRMFESATKWGSKK